MRQKGYREFEAGLRDTLSSRSTWATVGSSDPKELPKINCFVFICMGVLPERMCTIYVQCQQQPEEGIRSLRTGEAGCCELPCWGMNPGPLEEQPVVLTIEPHLQPPKELLKA